MIGPGVNGGGNGVIGPGVNGGPEGGPPTNPIGGVPLMGGVVPGGNRLSGGFALKATSVSKGKSGIGGRSPGIGVLVNATGAWLKGGNSPQSS